MPEWKPPVDAQWTPPADAKESWSPPEDAVEASPMDYAELVAGGAVNTLTSTPLKMLGAADETLNRYVYNPLGIGAGENYTSPATKAGNAVQNFFQPYVSQETQNSFGGQAAQGLGTGLAMMATGGASALGKGGAATLEGALTAPSTSLGRIAFDEAKNIAVSPTGVLGGAMTAVPEYEAAKAAGVPEDELFGILAKNYLVGQTEALPIQNMMGRINRLTGGTIYQKLLNTGKIMSRGAVEEGVQEGLQTYLSNEIAKGSYDPDRDPLWGVMRAATVGGFVGFMLPGIGAAINSAPESERPKLEKKVREIESLQQATELVNDASKELQVGNGLDEQIDQAARITDEQANAVQSQQISELEIEQNEDEQKRLEKLAKENDKENKDRVSSEERVGQTTEQKESDQSTGEEAAPASGVLEASQEVSPEYAEADKAYQEAATKLRQSPNIEIGPKGITPLNQEGIDEFRALTELWQKRDNIRIQELKTPKPRGSATVKMTPGTALKQQVQTFYRGVAKGVTKGSEMKSQLLNKVQEAIKEYPLSPKQVSSILTKVKKTNLFTPGSISRLNDYIGKVADDAQLAEKYDQAYALRKKIKGKKSSKNLSWQERDALKKFSAVDPDYVDIDQYLGQAQHVHDTLLKPVANRTALDTKSINNYVSSVPDTNQLRVQERQEKLAEELGLTPEEAAILLSDQGEEQTPADKREAVRQQLKEVADQAKTDLDEAEGDSPLENEVLKNLKELNTDNLTPEELRNYVRVVDRIVANGDFAGSGELMEVAKADKDFAQLLEKSKDWKILNLNAGEVGIDSLPMAVQAITGLPKAAAEFQSAMGTKEIGDASVEALTEEESLVDMMKRLEKDHKKAFTNDSIVRQGIYSELVRYQEDAYPNEALAQNKQLIEATIAAHRSAGESKEADKIAQLYKPFQDALTIDDVQNIMNQVDPDGKAVMDESQKFFEKYYDKIAEYNNIYFNEPTKKIINYTGPRKWLSSNGIDVSTDDFINGLNLDSGIPTEYKIGRPKQTSSAKQVNNQAPPNAMLNFNKHVVMSNGIRKTLFDAHAVGPLLRLVRNSRKKELLNVLGAREGDDKSIQKAADLQKKLFGKGGVATEFVAAAANKKIPDQFDKEVSKILSPLRKFGYTLSLSGISQIPKQATVLTNVALQLGGDVDLLPISDVVKGGEDIKNMLKGESISLRGSQKSNFSLGEVTSEKQMSEFSKRVNKFIDRGFEGWGGIKPLTKTDTGMAQLTWLAFYKKYLRDNNIDFKGWKEENNLRGEAERKAARVYAKQRTDVLQVTSNPHELGKWIKNQGAGAQILKALLIPYGSFNANTKARLWQDWRAMITGNREQRGAAAKDLGASLVEAAAFHSVSLALKVYIWSLLGQAMLSTFDLPDDPRREKRTWENAVKTWRTNVVLDAMPVLMTSPVESKVAVPLMNDMADRMLKYKDKNTMFYKYQSAEDDVLGQISELGGPYAVGPTKAIHWANLVGDWATGTKDVDGRERPLTPEQKRFLSMLLVAYSLHGAGYLPSDVINTIDKEYKNQQPGRRK